MFHFDLSALEPQNLAVKLSPSAESLMLKSAHPWVFSNSIQKINKEGKAGDIAILFRQNNNKVFGVGLYDPHSPIRIKMLHYYSGQIIDQNFFKTKIEEAYERSEEHTSELQSRGHLVCRLLLEKKKQEDIY